MSDETTPIEAVVDEAVGNDPAPQVKRKRKAKATPDKFATGTIPAGARGPSVKRLRAALGLDAEGSVDRVVTNAVRRIQADLGVPQTGVVNQQVRDFLHI